MLSKEESASLIEKYPFLLSDSNTNEFVYWNADTNNWIENLPKGWYNISLKMFDEIRSVLVKADELDKFEIHQLKEKFGELRLYFGGELNTSTYIIIRDIISKYTNISKKICFNCGRPATVVTKGWITYYCDNCIPEHEDYISLKYV